jgi:ribosome-associated translation inhibitor RaiA
MVIHVVYRGFSPTVAVKRKLDEARAEFEKLFKGLVSVEWALESEGSQVVASCRVHSRTRYYRASAQSHDPMHAVHEVTDRLVTQRRRAQAAVKGRRRKAATKRV